MGSYFSFINTFEEYHMCMPAVFVTFEDEHVLSLKEHSTLIVFTGWSHFFFIHTCDRQMRVCILIISWRNITGFIFSFIKSLFNFLHTWILQDRVKYDEPNFGLCHCFVNLLLSVFFIVLREAWKQSPSSCHCACLGKSVT